MRDGLAKLQFRRLEETAARVVDTPRELRAPWPGVETFWWSHDGKRLLFLMDRNEDERPPVRRRRPCGRAHRARPDAARRGAG